MAEFKFRLESLMKLREADRQQRRAELAEAFQAESVLRQQPITKNRPVGNGVYTVNP